MAHGERTELTFRLLGRFEAERDGEPIDGWPQRKTRSLLQLLLLRRGHVVPQDALIDSLFSELDPERARRELYSQVSRLRRVLEPDLARGHESRYVRTASEGYCIDRDAPCRLDVETFDAWLESARRHEEVNRWTQALEAYRAAVALYRGDLLEDAPYEEWTLRPRERYRDQYVQALERLAECHARLGQLSEAITRCEDLIAQAPARESAYRRLIRYWSYAGDAKEAEAACERCARALRAIDVEPSSETLALYRRIQEGDLPAQPWAVPHNLPGRRAPLVGRTTELKALRDALRDPEARRITLVGLGGVGKSRLAIQAGDDARDPEVFPNGVWWVSLADLTATNQIAPAIAEALSLRLQGRETPERQLRDFLREKRLLLILDEAEGLRAGAGRIDEVLADAPGVTLLATSRERLHLPGEHVVPVEGLEVPEGESSTDGARAEAAQLFVERARRVDPKFNVAGQEEAVARLCRRVEGLPLSLELAAAWVRVLSCAEIVEELERGLALLAAETADVAPRHRSLRAVFERTWAFLSDEERAALRRMSVFRGDFTREAAETVAGASLSALSGFVDKFMIQRDGRRFYVHGLLKRFAGEKLRRAEETTATAQRHAEHYAAFLERQQESLRGSHPMEALTAIQRAFEDVRAAWEWGVEQGWTETLARALGGLHAFYDMRGRFREGEATFQRAARRLANTEGADGHLVGKLRVRQGWFCQRLGRYRQAQELMAAGLAFARRWEDRAEEAFALCRLGEVTRLLGDYREADHLLRQSETLYREIDDRAGIAIALTHRGNVAWSLGDYEGAERRYRDALALHRDVGHRQGVARSLNNLGIVADKQGAYEDAKALLGESLTLAREIDNPRGTALLLNNLGVVHLNLEAPAEAEPLFRESLELYREIGDRGEMVRPMDNLGEGAYQLGRLPEARDRLKESLAIKREIGDRWEIAHTLNLLGDVFIELDEPEEAQRCLGEALTTAREIEVAPMALGALSRIGALLVTQGECERAAELLAHVRHHPESDRETRDRAERLLESLEAIPATDAVTAARSGMNGPLSEIVDEGLRALSTRPQ